LLEILNKPSSHDLSLILKLMGNLSFTCLRSEQLSGRNIAEYLALFYEVFGFRKQEGLFQRQFLPENSPAGYHSLMLEDGKIQASYSAIPLTFIYQNQEVQAALVVDAIVHPRFQGQGYLLTILEALYQKMKGDGFHFLYGMPNARFYPIITQKMGWKSIGQMHWSILFPGGPLPKFRNSFYCYRPQSSAYIAHRYSTSFARKTKNGVYWLGKSPVPGLKVLLDWETRAPSITSSLLLEVRKNGPILFPFLGKSDSGILIPDFLKGHRTRVVAFSLSALGSELLEREAFWLTLGDFDVG
jgi:hypothetical protein